MESNICLDKMKAVLSHIENVQRNCYKLGFKLIEKGDVEIGKMLIANGQIHDNSKFRGIEFEHLFADSLILSDVAKHHSTTNPHHAEYWGGIHKMPELYLAEMVCDCTARSAEFGDNIKQWFKEKATERYNFTMEDEVGKKITHFLGLLLTPAFK